MPCYIDPTLEVTAPFPTQELDIWLLLKPTSSPGCIWSSSWNNLVNQNLSTWMLVAKAATSFAKYRIKEYLQQNFWTWVWFPPMLKKNCTIGIQRLPLWDAGDVETNAVFLYCVGKYRLIVHQSLLTGKVIPWVCTHHLYNKKTKATNKQFLHFNGVVIRHWRESQSCEKNGK